jgi:hypothetical protein
LQEFRSYRMEPWTRVQICGTLVHQVSDWCSSAAVNFGWMREAKNENTRGGL